ncbi:MAG: ATP-binding protein [Pyrinomonadaceae bacterium]
MALKTEQKLPIVLFVVFLTLTIVGFLFYQSTASFQEALEWQRRANASIWSADEIGRLAMNVDRGVFGFVYTGNDTYLEPYTRAKTVIPQKISDLKLLAIDDEHETTQIAMIESAANALLSEADQMVAARKMGGPSAGIEQITNVMARPKVEAVQLSVRQYKDTVTDRLQSRDSGMDKGLSRSIWVLIAASLAGIIALGLANFIVFREIKKRQSAETELIETNRNLEEKVEERTEELLEMNERLIEIGSEREILLRGEQSARQEAEIANRLRDEFMATVSHELRTPLNSILGWARLLKDGTLDRTQSERAVTTIIKNSETQNRLIEDLLDVARLISGKLELANEPVDLLDVITDSIESVRPAANHKDVEFDFYNGSPNTPVSILGDSNRLRQVFSNLLTNSVKFSHEGGRVSVSLLVDGEQAVVEVMDEGVGISSDFLPVVFERFRQDLKQPGRNGGLGLGLAIVRNLVEMHGGSVSVTSDGENKGAKFTVRLPLIQS